MDAKQFAVQSTRRGTDQWRFLVKPFVSDLAFRSLVSRKFQSEVAFRPYTCHAAVLFVDLSDYSKITSAIAHRGAHFLSSCVNAYLSILLQIIHSKGGDVVKFAGDAVIVVWEGPEKELTLNVLCAALAVLEMRQKADVHAIEGTDLCFRFHCGLTCGLLESEIFAAPTHVNMQRLFHSVGGETMKEIGDLVDAAKSGEVCVNGKTIELLVSGRGKFKDVPGRDDVKMLDALQLDDATGVLVDHHIEKLLGDRLMRRDRYDLMLLIFLTILALRRENRLLTLCFV
jgi:class 3 adenylate cyclase